MKNFYNVLIVLGLVATTISYSNEVYVKLGKILCEEAHYTSFSKRSCKENMDINSAWAKSVSFNQVAIHVCKQGIGGAYARGWDCFQKANSMFKVEYQVDLRDCNHGRYYVKFACAYKKFSYR
ncbi:hypothetical protein N9N67_02285 [Bacteriovoracaceae bacterium]|nr:hypothetical protein [Bacteriovoracaceae bacterium]